MSCRSEKIDQLSSNNQTNFTILHTILVDQIFLKTSDSKDYTLIFSY